MHHLETLGRIRFTDDAGRDVDRLLKQPKRLALLAYLASPAPGTWHRRDVLLGIFWPELDAQRARTSLRNALHVLRQHVGAGVIRTRGDDDVSVDPSLFATDAADMERDASDGHPAAAFARYRGDYLRGLYIKEAESFERWVDDERRRLLGIAKKAGLAAADGSHQSGNVIEAIELVERLAELDPHDESVVRRLIGLLDRSGDHARALATYERFRDRLAEELNAEASAETIAQVEEIRARRAPRVERALASDSRSASTSVYEPPIPYGITSAQQPISPAPDTQPMIRKRRRAPAMMVRGAMVLAAIVATTAYLGARRRSADESSAVRPLTFAAVPCINVARDTALEYRAEGISEEILTAMGRVSGIQIVGRSAARRYKDRAIIDERAVEREIGARFLFTCTFRQSGGRLVVSAQLNDSMARGELWAGSFDRMPADLGSLSDGIARVIADTLRRRYVGRVGEAKRGVVSAGTTNSAALDYYLLGQALLKRRGSGVKQSVASFEAAITLDPKFARAHAALAKALALTPWFYGVPMDEVKDRVFIASQRALELDSTLADAHTALALVYPSTGEWAKSVTEFEQAIALEPANFDAHFHYARILVLRGNPAEALKQCAQARRLEQVSALLSAWTAYALLMNGQPDSALKESGRAIQLDSALLATANLGALVNLATGHPEVARRLMVVVPPVTVMSNAPYVYARLGDVATATRLVATMESNTPRPWFTDVARASVLLATGDSASALSALERSARTSGAMWPMFIPLGDPAFDLVRHSARFAALVRQAGLDVQSFPALRDGLKH